jgi:hypothetical protein
MFFLNHNPTCPLPIGHGPIYSFDVSYDTPGTRFASRGTKLCGTKPYDLKKKGSTGQRSSWLCSIVSECGGMFHV